MTIAPFVAFPRTDLERSIPERFAAQVARHPDRLAVQCGDERLSYAELDALSNRFAQNLLVGRPPEPEPVALLLGQGTALVVAILGILKAGKFYVPLDPAAPAAILDRQLDHSRARLVVADDATWPVATRHATAGRSIIRCAAIDSWVGADPPAVAIGPDSYAYIFYTSGTTGTPKGVVDSHRNVLHNVMRYTNALRIGPADRLTLLQAPHFSGAVSSLFGALLNGAAVFPLDLKSRSIGQIARTIAEQRITIYHSVPAIFERVVRTGLRFPDLRLIRLEGDQASRRHVELFCAAFDRNCRLVNGLGATETGITRQFFVDHDTRFSGNAVPLGHATDDMETVILDESGAAVAAGEIGEIAIRSRYLAVGYWRDPERTATAFAPVPGEPDRRLYRTGDLGRMRADGCLEYLGRRDFRARIGGRWLDADAIEAALQGLDAVDDAAVKVCEDAGTTRLVAYVVPAAGAAPSGGELRRRLAERLPADAVPARFVFLPSLPLNDNFKVDRAALPPPDHLRPDLDTRFVAPRDPIEQALAEIWCEILGLDRVGIDDAFFELGGDSLAALEVAHLVEARIEPGFPVADVLETPTVAAMAARIRAARPADCLVPIRPDGEAIPLFCVHDQSGEVLCYRELAGRLGAGRPVWGLRAVGGDATSVERMAARYVAAIARVCPQGPCLLAGNCFGGVIAYEMARQMLGSARQVALLVLLDTAFPSGRVRETLGRWRRWRWRLSDLSLEQRVAYAREKLVSRVADRRGRRRGESAAARHAAIERAMLAAGHRYQPEPYPGRALLVRIGAPTNQGGWEKLIGGLEVIELPLLTGRLRADVVRGPYVEHLAELLDREFRREPAAPARSQTDGGSENRVTSVCTQDRAVG